MDILGLSIITSSRYDNCCCIVARLLLSAQQMDLEESQRRHIDDLKKAEKESAEYDVYAALSKFHGSDNAVATAATPTPAAARRLPPSSVPLSASECSSVRAESGQKKVVAICDDATKSPESTSIWADDETARSKKDNQSASAQGSGTARGKHGKSSDADKGASVVDDDEDVVYVPPPRNVRKTLLSFTPRSFPTPMRESTARQEDDWLAKNKYKVGIPHGRSSLLCHSIAIYMHAVIAWHFPL
jgi:hypothetical protein